MPWVKVDDHFSEHPKMAAIGPAGWGVWLAGLAYCNRNLTDGFIPRAVAEMIGGTWHVRIPCDLEEEDGARETTGEEIVWSIDIGSGMHGEPITTAWVIEQLLRVGLWQEVMGGYIVHDFEDYQPTRAQVEAERAKKAAAGRAGGIAAAVARAKPPAVASAVAKSKPVPVPVPVPEKVPPVPAGAREASGTSALVSLESAGRPEADALDDYYTLTGRYPTGRTADWLTELANEFGHDMTGRALAAEWAVSSEAKTILSRTADRLRAEAHQAERERAKPRPRKRETPEERERVDAERRALVAEWTAQVKDVPKGPFVYRPPEEVPA